MLLAAAAMVGTLPARTQGLGIVTEHILVDLSLDRVTWAEINLWATLIGSGFAVAIGRVLDRFGARIVLSATALVLGVVVGLMSAATTVVAMVVLVTLARGVGQSALSVVSLTMVGQWFSRRLPLAMGVYAVVMSIGFMLAFPLVGAVVQSYGWRVRVAGHRDGAERRTCATRLDPCAARPGVTGAHGRRRPLGARLSARCGSTAGPGRRP